MHCICKDTCNTVDFKKNHITTRIHKNAFRLGFFRCRKCEYYIKGVNYCPCCGTRLATSPRNAKSKREYKKELARY
jgi:rubrerythrin